MPMILTKFLRRKNILILSRSFSSSSSSVSGSSGRSLQVGLVGLPNVGKSTLHRALCNSDAVAANYPFCTIDAEVGTVLVPDERLSTLASMNDSEKIIPTTIKIVDIAGLVEGCSHGAGMGNKFLSDIRNCDALIHVVRCHVDEDVVHVIEGPTDPGRDASIINSELILADLGQIERRKAKTKKQKQSAVENSALEKISLCLEDGFPARTILNTLTEEEAESVKHLGLLTNKKMIYAAIRDPPVEDVNNASESKKQADEAAVENVKQLKKIAKEEGSGLVEVSAQFESELADFDEE
eukprot:g1965.t1